jgi:hypothetical protein
VTAAGILSRDQELGRALRGIFSRGVASALLTVSDSRHALTPEEEAAVCDSPARRRAEFAAGRACARAALASLGLPGIPLLQEPDGSPRWPTGWTGSLSHSGGLCAAAVASRSRFEALGLDLQIVRLLEPDRARLFCDEREQVWIDAHEGPERSIATLFLFCAKECARKCCRGSGGASDPAEIGIEAEALPGPFVARVRGAGRAPRAPVPLISGRLALVAGFVVAGAEIPSRS